MMVGRFVARRALLALVLMFAAGGAFAQAGPPMITNDPDTPGPGKWEINLAASGGQGAGAWALAAPDVDINRGVGEHVQLSLHGAWAHARGTVGPWQSGLSDLELGVRWRFLDEESSGVNMAVQPLWIRGWSSASRRRGLASEHQEVVLPLQVARTFGGVSAGVEVARHLVVHDDDAWQGGAFVARDCTAVLTCLAEVNVMRVDHQRPAVTLNVGLRHPLSEHTVLMGSLGSEVSGDGRQPLVFYLGMQLLR